jgi:signal transduction histidine kinase
MTFTGRMRLALLLAAIFPTALISIIVVLSLSQQVKRIENRDAEAACGRFSELMDNTLGRMEKNLMYIIESREFQVMEWGLETDKQPDPRYRLPLLSLDFVEYLDSGGMVLISANRPALLGQEYEVRTATPHPIDSRLVYENDLHGSHPSIALMMPTENGYLRGGIFLDNVFESLAMALTRSTLLFVDIRDDRISPVEFTPPNEVGRPYRTDDDLYAVLAFDSLGDYYPAARFLPYEQQSLFANFLTAVMVVTVLSIILVVPAGLYFSARTRREFKILNNGAIRVAAGDFSSPVETTSGEGEFSDLADSFNRMMRQLTDYREKLIVSQKIAAWQTVGRKIAHEVKNPLTPIAVAVDDLKHSYHKQSDDFEEILNEDTTTIKNEIDRLKKMLNEFSSFAKMPPPTFAQVSASALVKDVEVLFKEEMAAGRLEIINDLQDTVMQIDRDQMRQVIINLIKNGLDACRDKCRVRLAAVEDYLELTVEDDGAGMPEAILEDGPTPYFSTKEHGSGLGLIICQRIVVDHDGTMNIENKPEGGARVIIALTNKL